MVNGHKIFMPYKLILILWYCPPPHIVIKPTEQSFLERATQTKQMLTKCFLHYEECIWALWRCTQPTRYGTSQLCNGAHYASVKRQRICRGGEVRKISLLKQQLETSHHTCLQRRVRCPTLLFSAPFHVQAAALPTS